MKKGTILSLLALLVSIIGLMVALIAYFKRRSCALCDDMENDLVEFYDDDEDCCCEECCCDAPAEAAPEQEAPSAPAADEDLKF